MLAFQQALSRLSVKAPELCADPEFDHYEVLLPRLEAAMWAGPGNVPVGLYQAFCREMESKVPAAVAARRHHIVVVVPVADRPRQLRLCLESLSACQSAYAYAGNITVVVVEDSGQQSCCEAHQRLVEHYADLDSYYLGLEEQQRLLSSLEGQYAESLQYCAGDLWREQMGHKGASVTRNIAMLWLASRSFRRPLFHFIDSDQAFHADVGAGQPRYMLNYFYYLDRLFRTHDIVALTGKVVGDPPVSPAVMAGTLLQDVNRVLREALPHLDEVCGFHDGSSTLRHGAYHDMAAMFGLDNRQDNWRYACPLEGSHTYADALEALSGRLSRFFDGEHPTRSTPFEYLSVEQSLSPARTVYTGNYVFNAEGLRHAIPFAPLRLRMAGPTLGRLLQKMLGERFVQANLPMLHQRTEEESGRSEFRPGVDHGSGQVDLSGEYERQFVGDWMLFGLIDLLENGYPGDHTADGIDLSLRRVEQRLVTAYADVREQVMQQLQELLASVDTFAPQTESSIPIRTALDNLHAFAVFIRHNYGEQSQAVMRLSDPLYRDVWRGQLAEALAGYPSHKRVWERLIESISS